VWGMGDGEYFFVSCHGVLKKMEFRAARQWSQGERGTC
jgi:hypothetical protein